MKQVAEARPDLGPYGRAIELLETSRSVWFAITTQFNALFEDISGVFPAASVLSGWMTHQIDALLGQLRGHVLQIEDGVSLRSVVEQTLLFGRRMGQIGCDFSSLVLPLFEECMATRTSTVLTQAVASFGEVIRREKLAVLDEFGNVAAEQAVPLYNVASSVDEGALGSSSSEVALPFSILQFPPLGFLLNSILTSLNYVRECPLRHTRPNVDASVRACLDAAAEVLRSEAVWIRGRGAKYLGVTDTPLDESYINELSSVLVPHVLRCLALVFDNVEIPS
jgi:hypothetical protein